MKKIKVLFILIFNLLFASCDKPREVNFKDTENYTVRELQRYFDRLIRYVEEIKDGN